MYTGRNDIYKYLCWLDQIRYLGRKSIFSLLSAAAERSLFFDEAMFTDAALSSETPQPGQPELPDESLSGADPGNVGNSTVYSGEEDDPFKILAAGARVLYFAPETQLRYLCSEAFRTPARAEKTAGLILKARKTEPDRIEEKLALAGITFCCFLEEDFPEHLRTIPDPPFGLYFMGKKPLFGEKSAERKEQCRTEPSAAIIGARLASGYGREQARRFSRRLASRGITIISGMARGIDGIAQKAALDVGGKSYAVLGCGVDICYPEENRELYDRLLQEGGIFSEYPPGTYPEARLFPQRNRIISGLSDVVLVIEARRRSGTLITVDMALEQGREVYALPGRVSDSLSDGCNRLIRQGAGAATCPEDILEYFYGAGNESLSSAGNKRKQKSSHVTPDDKKTLDTEDEEAVSAEKKTKAQLLSVTSEKTDMFGTEDKEAASAEKKTKAQALSVTSEKFDGFGDVDEKVVSAEKRIKAQVFPVTSEKFDGFDDMDEEVFSAEKKMSLEQGILRILSGGDETHLERILEGIQVYGRQKKLDSENISLPDVVTCLIRLKIDGRVEETSGGYYRRGEW